MPICPRCGKNLSSEQALTYHLNRKYRCNTWVCSKCTVVFSTKFDLHIHQLKCLQTEKVKIEASYPEHSMDFLTNLVKLPFIICEYDVNNTITYITPTSFELIPDLNNVINKNKTCISETYPNLKNVYDKNGITCFTKN